MNRSMAFVGAGIVALALVLFALPEITTRSETLGPELEAAVFVLGAGFSVILWAGASPNPAITTVGGLFGNRDEDAIRRWFNRHPPTGPARFRPSPLESVNCEGCYTAIPARALACPRCGANRRCRTCRKPLYFLAGAVRCAPCVRDELFCSCMRAVRVPRLRTAIAR
ncbi:MAG: hypothetical protein L3J93_01395 [Thermoplasmata archaeon]|nr:hypothetical protein [Thermoplasmata archaeon]